MEKLNEINNKISELYDEFSKNHISYSTTGNKAAGKRARLAIGEIKKLVTEYRKASIEALNQ